MPHWVIFTLIEREKMGILVNNVAVFGAQILSHSSSEFVARALANLTKLKNENEDLLKRLDGLAREHNEESPMRLVEDLSAARGDVAQMLTLVRRCISAAAFLGHLLAQPTHPPTTALLLRQENRLH